MFQSRLPLTGKVFAPINIQRNTFEMRAKTLAVLHVKCPLFLTNSNKNQNALYISSKVPHIDSS